MIPRRTQGLLVRKPSERMTSMLGPKCGPNYSKHEYGCVITMQHTAEVNEIRISMATLLADSVISATNDAVILANDVHIHHEQRRVFWRLCKNS